MFASTCDVSRLKADDCCLDIRGGFLTIARTVQLFLACSGWSWQQEDRRVLRVPRVPSSHFVNSNQIIEREH